MSCRNAFTASLISTSTYWPKTFDRAWIVSILAPCCMYAHPNGNLHNLQSSQPRDCRPGQRVTGRRYASGSTIARGGAIREFNVAHCGLLRPDFASCLGLIRLFQRLPLGHGYVFSMTRMLGLVKALLAALIKPGRREGFRLILIPIPMQHNKMVRAKVCPFSYQFKLQWDRWFQMVDSWNIAKSNFIELQFKVKLQCFPHPSPTGTYKSLVTKKNTTSLKIQWKCGDIAHRSAVS